MSTQTAVDGSVTYYFRPRRLGHANVFVSNYEAMFEYYHSVVGFEEVYRQPDNRASFISNGNTYHDFALTDVTSKYARPNQKPGLMHIAFELENEVELVEGYRRAAAADVKFLMMHDHDVAHSLYLDDPDGNGVELYADVVEDWRSARHGVFSKAKPQWIPGVTTEPVRKALYPNDPEIRVVADSVFRARRTTHVAFAARDFEAMFDYYTRIVGLSAFAGGRDHHFAVLGGAASKGAVTLLRQAPGLAPGLHHVGIEVKEADLARALAMLPGRAIKVEREVDHPARHAVVICDPDGLRLQFYFNRAWDPKQLATVSAQDAPYLL
jgi:catechol 2,3-dioxygenase